MTPVDWMTISPEWHHLKDVPFPTIGSKSIVDILIGVDQPDLHAAVKEVIGLPGEPIARKTPLGWTCVGDVSRTLRSSDTPDITNLNFRLYDMTRVNETLEKFWEIEESPEASNVEKMSTYI